MESLKQEALNVISKMPDTAEIDDIMYRLYVIDKVRKGREALQRGEIMPIEDLKKEIELCQRSLYSAPKVRYVHLKIPFDFTVKL